jgi:putative phosphoribosyl transferase
VSGRTVILVDDGVATGYTMRVAVLALRQLEPKKLVVAVPVGAPDTCSLLETAADAVVCPAQPTPFMAVGLWYDSFPQLTDEAVRAILAQSERRR